MKSTVLKGSALLTALLAVSPAILAQPGPPGPPPAARRGGPPPAAQQAARFDLTGYWVSVVTEDWRWRMLTAPTGDVGSIPANAASRKEALKFDGSKYGPAWTNKIDCRAYYAGGLMRMPTRLHITWAGPDTLKIESDWGQQTRLLYFKQSDVPNAGPTPQGSSLATWQLPVQGPRGGFARGGGPVTGGRLQVVTTKLSPGWLQRNGVPYGEKAQVTEWFQLFEDSTGKVWFDVTTKVEDPQHLSSPYVTSTDFRKEPDGSKWSPHACVKM